MSVFTFLHLPPCHRICVIGAQRVSYRLNITRIRKEANRYRYVSEVMITKNAFASIISLSIP
jgi:hypothetical protein